MPIQCRLRFALTAPALPYIPCTAIGAGGRRFDSLQVRHSFPAYTHDLQKRQWTFTGINWLNWALRMPVEQLKRPRQYGAWTPLSAEAQMDLQRVLDLRTVTNRPYPALRTGR